MMNRHADSQGHTAKEQAAGNPKALRAPIPSKITTLQDKRRDQTDQHKHHPKHNRLVAHQKNAAPCLCSGIRQQKRRKKSQRHYLCDDRCAIHAA